MNIRMISLNHPAVTVSKLLGREALVNGRVGVIERDPLGGYLPVVGFTDHTWAPAADRHGLVSLVMED